MKRNVLMAMAITCLYFTQSCNDPRKANNFNQETTVDGAGLDFIKDATEAGHTEVRASMLAEKSSTNPRVVGFAKMMVTDHTTALGKLDGLRKKELVNSLDKLNDDHKKMLEGLAKCTGSQFDKAYMEMMVKDHEQAVELFDEAERNRSGAVQAYAQQTLPTIKMHLDSAKNILASLK